MLLQNLLGKLNGLFSEADGIAESLEQVNAARVLPRFFDTVIVFSSRSTTQIAEAVDRVTSECSDIIDETLAFVKKSSRYLETWREMLEIAQKKIKPVLGFISNTAQTVLAIASLVGSVKTVASSFSKQASPQTA